jgi:hypothetical protein
MSRMRWSRRSIDLLLVLVAVVLALGIAQQAARVSDRACSHHTLTMRTHC